MVDLKISSLNIDSIGAPIDDDEGYDGDQYPESLRKEGLGEEKQMEDEWNAKGNGELHEAFEDDGEAKDFEDVVLGLKEMMDNPGIHQA